LNRSKNVDVESIQSAQPAKGFAAMRNNLISLTLFLIAFTVCHSTEPQESSFRSRREFAEAMTKVKEGMPQTEVLALLGKPEDLRTKDDAGGISTCRTKVIWRYGTSGHLTTATLGQVYFDEKDRVQYRFGDGEPDFKKLPEEPALRLLLDTLAKVPSYTGYHYDPKKVVRAVNLLQPLGKERALAVIEEFLRVSSPWHDDQGQEGIFLVLRTLFDVPDDSGCMPTMSVGLNTPESLKKDPKLLPRYPIALEQDIPFLVGEMCSLVGMPEQPRSHVEYFYKHGRIRSKPLIPTAKPLAALEAFAKSPRWIFTDNKTLYDDERGRHMLDEQMLRLLDSVYEVEEGFGGSLLPWGEKGASKRQQIMGGAAKLQIRWDPKQNKYTFLDGTSLPETPPKQYRQHVWDPGFTGCKIMFARHNRRGLTVCLAVEYDSDKPLPPAVFQVFKIGSRDKPIVEFNSDEVNEFIGFPAKPEKQGGGNNGLAGFSKTVELIEGTEVQVQLKLKDKLQTSPIYKP
jgi:hypothetical protein